MALLLLLHSGSIVRARSELYLIYITRHWRLPGVRLRLPTQGRLASILRHQDREGGRLFFVQVTLFTFVDSCFAVFTHVTFTYLSNVSASDDSSKKSDSENNLISAGHSVLDLMSKNLNIGIPNLLSVQCNACHWADIKSFECMSVCVCVCVSVCDTYRPR